MQLFCRGILDWYSVHKRTLPWRDLTTQNLDYKAYLVLVSEVMLQQTQVPRVIILYKKFIHTFPRIEDLAKATNAQILVAWRGLGYNSRALRLRDTARAIVSRGSFPREMHDLLKLPGIGHYTAGAIRNFAFGIPTPCIDVNIRRIFHRFFVGPENADGTWKKDDAYLLTIAEEALATVMKGTVGVVGEEGEVGWVDGVGLVRSLQCLRTEFIPFPTSPSLWHSALMDFGSLVCTKNNPKWDLFPKDVRACCKAYGKNITRTPRVQKKEPGRMMAGKFVPNRIFRGRIIEALRDAKKGLTLEQIGTQIAIDWTMGDHTSWLKDLLKKLKQDGFIRQQNSKFLLS